jgi:hypothetical protein
MESVGTLYVHRIDRDDVITFLDEEWKGFARENGAPGLADVAGRSLWDFVVGADVREIYRRMLDRVREDGGSIGFPFRCDAPALRRFLEMEIVPRQGGEVEFRSRLVAVDERPELIALLTTEAQATPSDEVFVSCSWCRRFRVESGWVEAEEAIRELGLFGGVPSPRISHGICEDCVRGLLPEASAGSGGAR